MDTILVPAGITLLLIVLVLLLWKARRRRRSPTGGVRPCAVLEGNQRRLYRTLKAALPDHHVLARIPFATFLTPRNSGEPQPLALETQLADFVICDSEFRVVAVVEMGIAEHRSERDALLRDAALPLVRWSVNTLPDIDEIRETIQDLESLHAMSASVTAHDARSDGDGGSDDTVVQRRGATGSTRREPRL
ncbi:DUF2726 domain-containing protein [Aquisalimonas sp.]|uniref:DUF2726 domain-containing protein n=1 Tax=Aquisalimonas sp. TaxID=1872621 RepID=UPI0025C3474F|nr:DUF2726 domain-containing protein [Aquisalimonas sp.]